MSRYIVPQNDGMDGHKEGAMQLEPGMVIEVRHPFIRSTYTVMEEDCDYEIPCWCPGTKRRDGGAFTDQADGEGQQILTVVSLHTPGTYPERVFYTRQWRDPDGKVFGKRALQSCSRRKFATMCHAYRYPYCVPGRPTPEEEEEEARTEAFRRCREAEALNKASLFSEQEVALIEEDLPF